MKKKRFLTLFGKAFNVELVKMPGKIPFKRNNFLWEKVVDRLQEQIEMLKK